MHGITDDDDDDACSTARLLAPNGGREEGYVYMYVCMYFRGNRRISTSRYG